MSEKIHGAPEEASFAVPAAEPLQPRLWQRVLAICCGILTSCGVVLFVLGGVFVIFTQFASLLLVPVAVAAIAAAYGLSWLVGPQIEESLAERSIVFTRKVVNNSLKFSSIAIGVLIVVAVASFIVFLIHREFS